MHNGFMVNLFVLVILIFFGSHDALAVKTAKRKWTKVEDEMILRQIKEKGENYAKIIVPGRLPKQIRERYLNHLREGIDKSDFTEDEWDKILESRKSLGNRWTEIAKLLGQGRTPNHVKNAFYSATKKKSQLTRRRKYRCKNLKKEKARDTPLIKASAWTNVVCKTIEKAIEQEEGDEVKAFPLIPVPIRALSLLNDREEYASLIEDLWLNVKKPSYWSHIAKKGNIEEMDSALTEFANKVLVCEILNGCAKEESSSAF